MNYLSKWRRKWHQFLHDEDLKQRIYSIVFESDTPKGKLFDIILIGSITLSVLLVILESMHIFPHSAYLALRITEYILTFFFTVEYLARIYCLKQPRKYIFSFFGIVDLLATLPVYLSFFLHGSHYLLVIRAFRLIRCSVSSSSLHSSTKAIFFCAPCGSVLPRFPSFSFSCSFLSPPWERSCI